MRLFAQPFENSVTEEWTWLTDVFVSTDGTEQRVRINELARRTLQPTWQFNEPRAAAKALGDMYRASDGIQVPAFQYSTKIAACNTGATEIDLTALRSELRDGDQAYIYDPRNDAYEVVGIDTVSSGEISLSDPLTTDWRAGARIAPLWAFVIGDNATMTRGRMGDSNISATLTPLDYIDPFLNPFNTTVLTQFAGLPLISIRPVGDDFTVAFNNGATLNDYGGVVSIRDQWQHTVMSFSRTFMCQRIFKRSEWQAWNKLADYCQGSLNPFYMPTFTADFFLVAKIDATHVSLEGTDYNDNFFPFAPFKQIAFFDASGEAFLSSVTACASAGGNSVLTLNPALPDGFAIATVSLLLKLRIADDKVSCLHDPLQTQLTINFRTCDE